jgi:hypothetical protein
LSRIRFVVGGVLAVALVAATAALSRLPAAFSAPDDALLRLSWRMTGATAEACRTLSPEELEKLPVHMRNPQACIGHIASYVITVRVDGTSVLGDTVRPAGARGDRPITVLRDLPLVPGRHGIAVAFDALLPEGVDLPESALRSLSWNGEVDVDPRGVALVTLDPEGRRLEYRTERGTMR